LLIPTFFGVKLVEKMHHFFANVLIPTVVFKQGASFLTHQARSHCFDRIQVFSGFLSLVEEVIVFLFRVFFENNGPCPESCRRTSGGLLDFQA